MYESEEAEEDSNIYIPAFKNVKAPVRTFYSLQCKARCLYSKFLFNRCVVKEKYEFFAFELVHMSLVNDKNEASDISVCIFSFKLS